jgi:hypothetical protein
MLGIGWKFEHITEIVILVFPTGGVVCIVLRESMISLWLISHYYKYCLDSIYVGELDLNIIDCIKAFVYRLPNIITMISDDVFWWMPLPIGITCIILVDSCTIFWNQTWRVFNITYSLQDSWLTTEWLHITSAKSLIYIHHHWKC